MQAGAVLTVRLTRRNRHSNSSKSSLQEVPEVECNRNAVVVMGRGMGKASTACIRRTLVRWPELRIRAQVPPEES